MKTEIKPHFRKTIEEIDGDIAQLTNDIRRLQGCRATLIELYAGDTELTAQPLVPIAADGQPRKKYQRTTTASPDAPAAGTGQGSGSKPSAEGIALMAHARKMAEPITAASLAVAGGVITKTAANFLARWAINGYLTRSGRGEFKRTAQFPEPK